MQSNQSKTFLLEILSCVHITKYNSPQNKTSYGRRISHDFELELILDGCGEIYCNGEWIETKKNRLFLRSKGMELEGITPYYSYFIVFDCDKKDIFDDMPFYIDIEDEFYIKSLFETIYAQYNRQSYEREYVLKGSLCMILAYIIRKNEQNKLQKQSNIYQVMKYINQNIENELLSSNLAKIAGLSQNYFVKCFKEITGKNPIEYINDARVLKGCSMLVSTNYSVEEIARQCGYPSASYFYRKFKQKTGENPASYRKKMRIYNTFE
ncbi:AraC family transcriptional regulator [Paludicola sp. MB14-C6]|uniref:helix-turn-helix domain-containing protein n=1 Tax=Paludihabitans sp. MB14-C6 TaxID=3070656 RepID=UPI0027DAEF07|nr:AraC family transcriptional regulator [Paludicola sp. MB14-C6]WMJ22839.1 AraC family transcriptional regulator [Paludicola sp. MB14-C6]